jgi:tetratricopeptide (TPR) repeat protein
MLVTALVLGVAGLVAGVRRWPGAPPALGPVLFGLVLALAVAVPTWQNRRWSGDTVLLAFGGGPNFYIGNHAAADGGYVPLRPDRFDPPQEEADAVLLASRSLGRSATAAEVSRFWYARGFDWWRRHPWRAVALTGKKLALLWGPYELADAYETRLAGRWVWLLRDPLVGPWLVLPAALGGLWMTRRERALWPLQAFVLGAQLAIVPFFLFERFRLHLVAACMPFAAVAGEHALALVHARRWLRLATGLLAVVVVGGALACARAPRDETALRVNTGETLFQAGRYEEALQEFEAVRGKSPDAWRVDINIANTQVALERPDSALAALDRVIGHLNAEAARTHLPSAEELLYCHELAGDLLRDRGHLAAAAEHYDAAMPFASPDAQRRLRDKLATCRIEDPTFPPPADR